MRAVLSIDQVAVGITFPSLDQSDVGADTALEDVGDAVKVLVLFALGDKGADAGAGVEAGDAGAAGTHAFGEGALGGELDFDLAGEVLALELFAAADIA